MTTSSKSGSSHPRFPLPRAASRRVRRRRPTSSRPPVLAPLSLPSPSRLSIVSVPHMRCTSATGRSRCRLDLRSSARTGSAGCRLTDGAGVAPLVAATLDERCKRAVETSDGRRRRVTGGATWTAASSPSRNRGTTAGTPAGRPPPPPSSSPSPSSSFRPGRAHGRFLARAASSASASTTWKATATRQSRGGGSAAASQRGTTAPFAEMKRPSDTRTPSASYSCGMVTSPPRCASRRACRCPCCACCARGGDPYATTRTRRVAGGFHANCMSGGEKG